jgi:hypothetical protein
MRGKIRDYSQYHNHDDQDKYRIDYVAVNGSFELEMLDPDLESQDYDNIKNNRGNAFDDQIIDLCLGFLSQRF